MPRFCLTLSFLSEVAGFPRGLSPRTMQRLGSIQYLVFWLAPPRRGPCSVLASSFGVPLLITKRPLGYSSNAL